MSASSVLIRAVRSELRRRGMTYRILADRLGLSESTIKRDFARGNFSLKRLDAICRVLNMEVDELLESDWRDMDLVTELSREQEAELISNPRLLLCLFLIVNNWRFDDIMNLFRFDENELVETLLRLDQLAVINYQPPYHFKRLTARNFTWRRDGPVHHFFMTRLVPEFFDDRFDGTGDALHLVGAVLSEGSRARLQTMIRRLVAEFEEVTHSDARLPLGMRKGCCLILGFRKWEFSDFAELRRDYTDEAPGDANADAP